MSTLQDLSVSRANAFVRALVPIALQLAVFAMLAMPASAKERITYAHQLDPVFEALLWGIKTGAVQSALIEIEATSLDIPALIQATATKRFDVIQTDVIGVARAAERGLELRILSTAIRYRPEGDAQIIFVPVGSPLRSVADLRGMRIAVTSLGSTGFNNLRFALSEFHGLNVDVTGGDIRWIQLPPATMYAALTLGRVDAASLSLTHTYRAKLDARLRPAVYIGRELYDRYKLQLISSVNVGYPERLAARPAQFREFNRLLRASAVYMQEHADVVYAAVGARYKVDPEVLKGLQATLAEFPARLERKDLAALAKEWELARKYRMLKSAPAPERLIWDGVEVAPQ